MTRTHNCVKTVLKDIGAELKRVREEKGLSIEQAAEMVGLQNPKVIERIEKGKPNLVFKTIWLIVAYQQKVNITLEDIEG